MAAETPGEAFVSAGLACYAAGDLRGALDAWERALRLVPDDARAREYISYVRDNYTELQAQFDLAVQVKQQSEAEGVPFNDAESAEDDDAEAYASMDISHSDIANPVLLIPAEEPHEFEPEEATTPEPRPGMLRAATDMPLRAGAIARAPAAAAPPPQQRSFAEELATEEHGNDDLMAVEGEFDTEFSDAPRTSERAMPGVIVDDALLGGNLDPELEHTHDLVLGRGEKPMDALRRRTVALLRAAEEAAERAEYATAVEAVETAVAEDTDGVVAPGLLFERRDLVYRIYEGHIGDLSQVPLVAVPLHEIAAQNLNHRTGFLLSRIDGMLSFEDILDVAGMPRMEAYKILSGLLRKGVIEVR